MKYYYSTIFFLILNSIFAQQNLANKIFYGFDYFPYKDNVKGKIGDVTCNVFIFNESEVTILSYNRFVYDLENIKNNTPFIAAGTIKKSIKNYTLENDQLKIEHKIFKFFEVSGNEINAYKNQDFKKLNVANIFIEISETDLHQIIPKI